MLADRRYGYLLTVTNHAFRYLLGYDATESNAEKPAFTALEHPFRELGCRRTSVPTTASRSLPNGLFNLSKGFSLVAAARYQP
jgi:hypothetical protein